MRRAEEGENECPECSGEILAWFLDLTDEIQECNVYGSEMYLSKQLNRQKEASVKGSR